MRTPLFVVFFAIAMSACSPIGFWGDDAAGTELDRDDDTDDVDEALDDAPLPECCTIISDVVASDRFCTGADVELERDTGTVRFACSETVDLFNSNLLIGTIGPDDTVTVGDAGFDADPGFRYARSGTDDYFLTAFGLYRVDAFGSRVGPDQTVRAVSDGGVELVVVGTAAWIFASDGTVWRGIGGFWVQMPTLLEPFAFDRDRQQYVLPAIAFDDLEAPTIARLANRDGALQVVVDRLGDGAWVEVHAAPASELRFDLAVDPFGASHLVYVDDAGRVRWRSDAADVVIDEPFAPVRLAGPQIALRDDLAVISYVRGRSDTAVAPNVVVAFARGDRVERHDLGEALSPHSFIDELVLIDDDVIIVENQGGSDVRRWRLSAGLP